ncbi:MAG: hypothetical protein R3E39_31425 [Anaerolineae bacterium]
MFAILWKFTVLFLIANLIVVASGHFLAPAVHANDYIVYHVPHRNNEGYDFYLHDLRRDVRINISHIPCARNIMPEALTGSTGRYLYVTLENDQLAIGDSYWGVVCRL